MMFAGLVPMSRTLFDLFASFDKVVFTFSRFQAIFGWVSPACFAFLFTLSKPTQSIFHFSTVDSATFFAILFIFILLAGGGGGGDGPGLGLLSLGGAARGF